MTDTTKEMIDDFELLEISELNDTPDANTLPTAAKQKEATNSVRETAGDAGDTKMEEEHNTAWMLKNITDFSSGNESMDTDMAIARSLSSVPESEWLDAKRKPSNDLAKVFEKPTEPSTAVVLFDIESINPTGYMKKNRDDAIYQRIVQICFRGIRMSHMQLLVNCKARGVPTFADLPDKYRKYVAKCFGFPKDRLKGASHAYDTAEYLHVHWPLVVRFFKSFGCQEIMLTAFNGSPWDFPILIREMRESMLRWPAGIQISFCDARPFISKYLKPPSEFLADKEVTKDADKRKPKGNEKKKRGTLTALYKRLYLDCTELASDARKPVAHTADGDVEMMQRILLPTFMDALLADELFVVRHRDLLADPKSLKIHITDPDEKFLTHTIACSELQTYAKLRGRPQESPSLWEIVSFFSSLIIAEDENPAFKKNNRIGLDAFMLNSNALKWMERVFVAAEKTRVLKRKTSPRKPGNKK